MNYNDVNIVPAVMTSERALKVAHTANLLLSFSSEDQKPLLAVLEDNFTSPSCRKAEHKKYTVASSLHSARKVLS